MQKFENMDVIAALEAIMHQNTAYYQSDFAYDIKMLREATRSNQPEDKLLLWLSRPSGTFCFRERDVLLKDTQCYSNLNHTSAAHTTPPVTGVLPLCTRLRRVRRNNPPWRSL